MGYGSAKKVSKKASNVGKIRTKIVASFLMALHPIPAKVVVSVVPSRIEGKRR
jgi:hypothetical protein